MTEGKMGLSTEQLAVGYRKKTILTDISFTIKPGEIVTLVGPNGSGKSTILKTITRQIAAVEGDIYLFGKKQNDMSGTEIAKTLSMVMTERITPELMTCREVVSTGRYPYSGRLGILSKEDQDIVLETMEFCEISEIGDRPFLEISDGQRQRVMLARALCQRTGIIVLDEPTSFLDIYFKIDLLNKLQQLVRERQIAVLMSLHELDLAIKISDRILCVDGETIVRYGTPQEVMEGHFLQKLYGLSSEQFHPYTGSCYLQKKEGPPKVFVIGGGGSAMAIYFQLQRQQIPFVAGILAENDVEYDMARSMAAEVIYVKAYYPIGEESLKLAKRRIEECEKCICCLHTFGPLNEPLKELQEHARNLQRLYTDDEMSLWEKGEG